MFFCRNLMFLVPSTSGPSRACGLGRLERSLVDGIRVEGTLPGGDALSKESGVMEKYPKNPCSVSWIDSMRG